MRLEVRCCCQPRKLLGWLPVADPDRGLAEFWIRRPGWQLLDWRRADDLPPRVTESRGESIVLAIERINLVEGGERTSRLALKAEGIAIEKLRRIPDFEEAL